MYEACLALSWGMNRCNASVVTKPPPSVALSPKIMSSKRPWWAQMYASSLSKIDAYVSSSRSRTTSPSTIVPARFRDPALLPSYTLPVGASTRYFRSLTRRSLSFHGFGAGGGAGTAARTASAVSRGDCSALEGRVVGCRGTVVRDTGAGERAPTGDRGDRAAGLGSRGEASAGSSAGSRSLSSV